jgi:hypothetical protein
MNWRAGVLARLREHHGAGAATALAAGDFGPSQADAVQIVHQQHRGVGILDHDLLAIKTERQLR